MRERERERETESEEERQRQTGQTDRKRKEREKQVIDCSTYVTCEILQSIFSLLHDTYLHSREK